MTIHIPFCGRVQPWGVAKHPAEPGAPIRGCTCYEPLEAFWEEDAGGEALPIFVLSRVLVLEPGALVVAWPQEEDLQMVQVGDPRGQPVVVVAAAVVAGLQTLEYHLLPGAEEVAAYRPVAPELALVEAAPEPQRDQRGFPNSSPLPWHQEPAQPAVPQGPHKG